tara:strand:- start:222 stop:560 length:339 start_codon:yes stop_codon:yes gene_type:complete
MLNKQKVQSFRGDFEKAVAQLGKQYGVNITLGTIRYDSAGLRATMNAKVSDGEVIVKPTKGDFSVGDVVFIVHKKVDPIRTFEIIKINAKNIKVRDRDNNQMLNVSPSLLKK